MAQETIEMVRFTVRPGAEEALVEERPQPRRDGRPILADTTMEAARQLDLAEAIAEVYKTDPEFVAPRRVYEGLRRAAPDLLL